jgi:hypothetical protein
VTDEIAKRVYLWEHNYVAPKQRPEHRLLTRDQCRDFVLRACAMTGTRPPTLRFKASHLVPCSADLHHWEITLAEWGHSAHAVLHETAHLATFRSVVARENGHGPTFVRQAIEYYERLMGLDPSYLEAAARRCGVEVGPAKASMRGDVSQGSPFADEVF